MQEPIPSFFQLSEELLDALETHLPVVALESTVITHGLPYPQNLQLAQDMEREVRAEGAVPATIAVIDGLVRVGLDHAQLQRMASESGLMKISTRDYAQAVTQRRSGGTTVAGTLVAAQVVGVRVLATGGIGGVHRQAPFDVSADLYVLARTPLVTVCAGAKAILDLPATLELLETLGVPVVGYFTHEFPAFYARSSGLPLGVQVDSPAAAAKFALAHWEMGLSSAVLVVQPTLEETAVDKDVLESVIQQALQEAKEEGIQGQAVTPFLLKRVSELTQGASLQANLDLLINNARLAAQISKELYP
jgi:pseudouridine-5'-phosphate glycosidase